MGMCVALRRKQLVENTGVVPLDHFLGERFQGLVVVAACEQVCVKSCLYLFVRLAVVAEEVHHVLGRWQTLVLELLLLESDVLLLQKLLFSLPLSLSLFVGFLDFAAQ